MRLQPQVATRRGFLVSTVSHTAAWSLSCLTEGSTRRHPESETDRLQGMTPAGVWVSERGPGSRRWDDPEVTVDRASSSPRPYDVWDISDWAVMSQEARGLDPKDWVVPPDQVALPGQAHWWLFKPIKTASYRRYDDWAEKLSAEFAGLLDLPSARVELARGEVDEGIVSGNVTPDGWSMESGDVELSEFDGYLSCATDDRPRNRVGHNLQNIACVLDGCSGPPGSICEDWSASEVFAGYLVFDAWVANTDRHAINWGFSRAMRMACKRWRRPLTTAARWRLGRKTSGSRQPPWRTTRIGASLAGSRMELEWPLWIWRSSPSAGRVDARSCGSSDWPPSNLRRLRAWSRACRQCQRSAVGSSVVCY